ncbi:MAG: hypothetical protein EOP48_12795 [Sphingobacteriales bacterium]|nr:MAG: hypothetical protein EOP48_12795 [Sphingobacteriales bacterium]
MPPEPKSIFDLFDFEKISCNSWSSHKHCPFYITFPEIKAGWFAVRLSWGGKNIRYEASNVLGDGGLDPLLEAVIDLLPHIGQYDKYFKHLRTHTRFTHDLEPDQYVWDIQSNGSTFKLLLRNYPNLEYEDDRFYHEMDEELLELDYEDITPEIMQKQVIMAVEINQEVFVAKLYIACLKLLEETGEERYKEEWNEEFPLKLLHRLEQYIMFVFPHQSGFWDYSDNDYRNRITGIIGTESFAVVGRKMATVAELKSKGLW